MMATPPGLSAGWGKTQIHNLWQNSDYGRTTHCHSVTTFPSAGLFYGFPTVNVDPRERKHSMLVLWNYWVSKTLKATNCLLTWFKHLRETLENIVSCEISACAYQKAKQVLLDTWNAFYRKKQTNLRFNWPKLCKAPDCFDSKPEITLDGINPARIKKCSSWSVIKCWSGQRRFAHCGSVEAKHNFGSRTLHREPEQHFGARNEAQLPSFTQEFCSV